MRETGVKKVFSNTINVGFEVTEVRKDCGSDGAVHPPSNKNLLDGFLFDGT